MKAIVFDNAGTILRRVTALKNMSTNEIIFETNTIGIVNKNDDYLILVFQTPTKKLIKNNSTIADFLNNNRELFEIGYSKKHFSKDEIINAIKEETATFKDIQDSAVVLIDKYDIEICSGSAMIVNMSKKKIEYVYTAGGVFFKQTKRLFEKLNQHELDIYIASGDNRESLSKIASKLEINPKNIYDTCNVDCKQKVVSNLQDRYDSVIMVGNQSNDLLALKQADTSILSIQQKEELPEQLYSYVDYVIEKIDDVLKIVENEV